MRNFGKEKITALSAIQFLSRDSPESKSYSKIKEFNIDSSKGEKQKIEDWINAVSEFLNPHTRLDTALFIICLGLITNNNEVREDILFHENILEKLKKDIIVPNGKDRLNGKGRDLLENLSFRYYTSPFHSDEPSSIDHLNRYHFAEVIAIKIDEYFKIKSDSKIFRDALIIHVDGAWGSGKTSLLNLIRQRLENRGKKYLVVDFNAWQHQRIGPPWWSILDAVYNKSLDDHSKNLYLRKLLKISDIFRRKFSRRSKIILFIIGSILLISAVIFFTKSEDLLNTVNWILGNNTNNHFPPMDEFFEIAAGVLTAIGSLVSYLTAFKSSILPTSAKSAQESLNERNDPMLTLNLQFRKLIQKINSSVVIFVDDLDRCKYEYVTEFLEGIQTLFRSKTNIVFVITADKQWLIQSYANMYKDPTFSVGELGRPLSYLFLDKIFQISISIPELSEPIQNRYLKHITEYNESEKSSEKTNNLIDKFIDKLKNIYRIVINKVLNTIYKDRQKKAKNQSNIPKNEADKIIETIDKQVDNPKDKAYKILKAIREARDPAIKQYLIEIAIPNFISKLNTAYDIRDIIDKEDDPKIKQYLIKHGIPQIINPEVEKKTEHYLKKFVNLMESNPRAMKHLVNTYNIFMIKLIILEIKIPEIKIPYSDMLVRWVILSLRWPYLIDYLKRNNDLLYEIDSLETVKQEISSKKISKENSVNVRNTIGKNITDQKLQRILLSNYDILRIILGYNDDMKILKSNIIKDLLKI